jgi:hypothetical protein
MQYIWLKQAKPSIGDSASEMVVILAIASSIDETGPEGSEARVDALDI